MRAMRFVLPAVCGLIVWAGGAAAQDKEAALMEADRAFAAHAAAHGWREAFLAYMAEDALILRAGGEPLRGRAAFAESGGRDPGNSTLSWAPEGASVSDDGTLGYTWGYSLYRAPLKDGTAQEIRGKYLTVWRLQKDGGWKFIADIGNSEPAAR